VAVIFYERGNIDDLANAEFAENPYKVCATQQICSDNSGVHHGGI